MRVASLLPAATEIVAALGLADSLVGVSHECDHPPEVATRPRLTHCAIHGAGLASQAVDAWVRSELVARGALYTIDADTLRVLAPDVILTQGLCDVCAPSYDSVAALAATLPGPPRVLNLDPRSLADMLANIHAVGAALGVPQRASALVAALAGRIAAVQQQVAGAPSRRCVLLEWLDPPFRSGHWDPELVELAGGVDPLGHRHEPATTVAWEAIVDAAPEVLVVSCCGYDVGQSLADLRIVRALPAWAELPAVRAGQVWVFDGTAYFSRPGPRLVDSLELLARLLHPDRFEARPLDPAVVTRAPVC